MKLQSASVHEIKRIAIGTFVLDIILVAGLFLLSQFDIGVFQFGRILVSVISGSVIAIGNFTILCLTIQRALDMTDQKKMKAHFQLSYNLRMIIQASWVVASFLISGIHFVAAATPVLFPKLTILYLQSRGKLMPKDETAKEEISPEVSDNE